MLINRLHGDDVGYVGHISKGMARVEVRRFVEEDLRWEAWFCDDLVISRMLCLLRSCGFTFVKTLELHLG